VSHFGDPAEKAAVRQLAREGVAIVLREGATQPGGVSWLVARLTPTHAKLASDEQEPIRAKRLALRAAVKTAIAARDAIEGCFTPEWRAAHARATEACQAESDYVNALSRDRATRYGSWRTPTDRELQLLGYL
jgi:hypothetical protein